jgi:uncharacterized membrane protein HdeD (DUF308 family)
MKDWLKWLILGVVSIVFGIFVLGNAVVASIAVTTLTGFLFLLSGGFQIYAAITSTEGVASKVFHAILGGLMVLLGASFTLNPLEGTISLALLVLILLAASGIVRLILAWKMRQTVFFWMMLVSGALSVLLAAYIWMNFATVGPSLLGILLGIELLFNGGGLIALGLFMRSLERLAKGK